VLVYFLTVVIAFTALVYFLYWRHRQNRLRMANWDWIVSQIYSHSAFNFDTVSRRYLYGEGINATPSNVWEKINGVTGLWAMFRNAGLFLRMMEYATEHGAEVPEELLESIRADALQTRLAVLLSIAKYVSTTSQAAACVNAHRAATAYSSMLNHMTKLFQEHSTVMFPQFLECM
jgi:hypothetical protein